jgi:phage/plasmid-associated DNA primase
MIFWGNVANVSPDDLMNGFNASYATSNLIAIEETLIEKQITIEKLKALSTQKKITVNQKHISHYEVEFYGKIILTSNNEDKFARIDEEEIRFFVRKLGIPKFKNHDIERNLKEEIPAFLHYLTTLPPIDFSKDRTGFTPQELNNEFLKAVKEESKSWLCKELLMHFEDLFENEFRGKGHFYADAKSIKDKYYSKDNRAELSFIRKVLEDELHLKKMKESRRLMPLDSANSKQGRFFIVEREKIFPELAEEPESIPEAEFKEEPETNQELPF